MGSTIELNATDGNVLSAYVARPEEAPKGAVVVVQEIFGVNDHIRSVADGYAAQGYLSIAPALFDRAQKGVELGYDAEGIEIGRAIAFDDVTMDEVLKDVEAAVDFVSEAGRVGIVGYCWGGSICYVASARLGKKISAAAGYYGGQILPYLEERPVVPLVLHFGEKDHGIPLERVKIIEERWEHIDVHVYEGADHGFNCDARGSYEQSAAQLALERTLSLFSEHI
jgi:carboxymethylenebutenolidase